MISFPDDLLARLDRRARERATTRSGLLQRLAERELDESEEERRQAIRALLAQAASHDGRGTEWIREDRSRL